MRKFIKERFRVLWEGNLSLQKISWHIPLLPEYHPSREYETAINVNWKEHKAKYPNDYNGTSLFLYDFTLLDDKLTLLVGTIKYSVFIYLYKNNIQINTGLGVLGVQSLVFSPNQTHFIVGKRSSHQQYYPKSIALPGGICEKRDFELSPSKSLVREINEEIPLPLEPENFLTAILTGWNGVSTTFLITTTIKHTSNFNFGEVISGDPKEWDGNLRWINSTQLKELDYKEVTDGLYYYKWKLCKELCKN